MEEPQPFDKLLKRHSSINASMAAQFARLLTEEDLNRVKDKFQEDTDIALEEAIRKHVRCL